uniref:Uncharacterized protein n=1 Tax=Cacopsylla melanoneura TaxID=428564 RepID=A0A8D8U6S1_9HEMI
MFLTSSQSIDGQMLVEERARTAFSEFRSDVTISVQHPFGCEKTLNTNGTSGVNAGSTDSDFGSQSESVAVSKSGTGIVEHTGTVHFPLEFSSSGVIFSHNHISVATTVGVNVVDSFLEVADNFDGAFQTSVFGLHGFGWRRSERQFLG